MTKQEKYFVASNHFGFAVVYEAFDPIAGHFYETAADGFDTENDARAHADVMNRSTEDAGTGEDTDVFNSQTDAFFNAE